MSDPKRLLQGDSDADALERALLKSLHDDGPSSADKSAIWQGVSAGVIAAGVVSGSAVAASSAVASTSVGASAKLGTAGAIAAGVGSGLPKAMLIKVALLTILGGASVGGIVLYRSQKSALPVATRHVATALPEQPVVPPIPPAVIKSTPTIDVAVSAPKGSTVKAKSTSPHAKRSPPDLLARESALLTEARAALRAGNVMAAQETLELMARELPRGVLAQEREVLAIELLLARGKRTEAQADATRFIERHPESPHSARLERLLK